MEGMSWENHRMQQYWIIWTNNVQPTPGISDLVFVTGVSAEGRWSKVLSPTPFFLSSKVWWKEEDQLFIYAAANDWNCGWPVTCRFQSGQTIGRCSIWSTPKLSSDSLAPNNNLILFCYDISNKSTSRLANIRSIWSFHPLSVWLIFILFVHFLTSPGFDETHPTG